MDQLIGQQIGDILNEAVRHDSAHDSITQQQGSAGQYKIESLLGKQTGRRTYLATDSATGHPVVIKLVLFGPDFTWTDLRLFEREAETLRSLNHPSIPNYLDSFEVDTPMGKGFALVQTYIEARSLQQWVKAGRTFSEMELKAIAAQILAILSYLHERHPPVIHRDIKPSNILLIGNHDGSFGKLYLIDFGSVQTTPSVGTMTIVGTYGYMPMEQFGGRAIPASDLYSMGATLLYLSTGKHPADMTDANVQINIEKHVRLTPPFTQWLKALTYKDLSRRTASAEEALNALDRLHLKPSSGWLTYKKFAKALSLSTTASKVSLPPVLNDLKVSSSPGEISIQLLRSRLIKKTSVRSATPFLLTAFWMTMFVIALSIGLAAVVVLLFFMLIVSGLSRKKPKKGAEDYPKTNLQLWLPADGEKRLNLTEQSLSNQLDTLEASTAFDAEAVQFPLKRIEVAHLGHDLRFIFDDNAPARSELRICGSHQEIQFLCQHIARCSQKPLQLS